MTDFQIAAALVTLASLFGYFNHRVLRMPPTIGVMVSALVVSLIAVLLGELGVHGLVDAARAAFGRIDLSALVLEVLLGFLLFAGALHIDLHDLRERRYAITSFATASLLISTALIGALLFLTLPLIGGGLPFGVCLLFGALISPTDPVAVLGIMKRANASRSLQAKIVGESLFNDGLGVVIFATVLSIIAGGGHGGPPTVGSVALFLAQEALGGLAFGALIGWLGYRVLRTIDDHQLEILITVALAAGGYAAAAALHLSAPLAMVMIGLFIGNRGRRFAMSEATVRNLDTFWEMVDELLNVVLFLLIGLELLLLPLVGAAYVAGLLALPIVLLSRFIGIGIPVSLLRLRREFSERAVRIITWAGLRGGISVALALAVPADSGRTTLLAMTYVVVVFSILVQGLTLQRVINPRQ